MIEETLAKIFDSILTGGPMAAVNLLLAFVIYFMWKWGNAIRAEADATIKDQFEKRLVEYKTVVDALKTTGDTLGRMQASIDARTEAINNLTGGFANLVRDLEANRTRWADKGDQWSDQLKEVRDSVKDLQNRGRT